MFGYSKNDKLIAWVNTVYQARVHDFDASAFIKQIEPFGGREHRSYKQYWTFDTYEMLKFWGKELETRYVILTTKAIMVEEPRGTVEYTRRTVRTYIRLVYQPDIIYCIKSGTNQTLRRRVMKLWEKDKKYGQRGNAGVRCTSAHAGKP
jgi:hypothetical protein